MPLPDGGMSDDVCIRCDTIPQCDIQTDGRICHNNTALCMHGHARRAIKKADHCAAGRRRYVVVGDVVTELRQRVVVEKYGGSVLVPSRSSCRDLRLMLSLVCSMASCAIQQRIQIGHLRQKNNANANC